MADLLDRGLGWLEDQRHKHLTKTVVYDRQGATVEVQATIGRHVFEQIDEFNVLHRIESRDFLIRSEDLVIGGTLTTPRAGDRVREAVGDTVYLYEVMAPAGEPAWRYSDAYRRTLRIHTKWVGTE